MVCIIKKFILSSALYFSGVVFFSIEARSNTAPTASNRPVMRSAPGTGQTGGDVYQSTDTLFQELAQVYGLKSCEERESNNDNEDEENDYSSACGDESGDNEYYFSGLLEACEEVKNQAVECCQSPSECTSTMQRIVMGAGTIAPALYAVFSQNKTSKKIARDKNLTPQQKSDKLCSSGNKVAMFKFSSDLIGQFMPLLIKDCGKRIDQCKKRCGDVVRGFEKDLRKVLNTVIPGPTGQGQQTKITVREAKTCLLDSNGNVPFDEVMFRQSDGGLNSFSFGDKRLELNSGNISCQDEARNRFYSQVLFYTKSYYNTMKNKEEIFAYNEKEIIDCADIEDRVVGPNNRIDTNQITPPMVNICKTLAKDTNNFSNPPSPSPIGNAMAPPPTQTTGSLTGDDKINLNTHPLLASTQQSEEDLLPPIDGFNLKKSPGLSGNLPSFGAGSQGGGGSSGGGGLGGGGSSGGGGSGGDSSGDGDYYEDYSDSGGGAFGGSFSGGYAEGSGMLRDDRDDNFWTDRELGSEDDRERGFGPDRDYGDEEQGSGDATIFQIASKHIQYFCTNLKCTRNP